MQEQNSQESIMHYHFQEKSDVKYLVFDSLQKSGLVLHGFTARQGGASPPPYDSLNLGLTSGDERTNVLSNRRILEKALGFYPEENIWLDHGREVYVAAGGDRDDKPHADAVITRLNGLPLTIFYADCVPIYILDRKNRAIGLAHGGWRGTVKDVAGNTIERMTREFGTDPADCLVGIGPSIGPCCFLVDEDVANLFLGTFAEWKDLVRKISNNKWSIDLWSLNQRLLISRGVSGENISICALCTSCNRELFYSYRRDRGNTGRMAAFITLLDI